LFSDSFGGNLLFYKIAKNPALLLHLSSYAACGVGMAKYRAARIERCQSGEL